MPARGEIRELDDAHAMLAAVPCAVFLIAADGTIVGANAAAEQCYDVVVGTSDLADVVLPEQLRGAHRARRAQWVRADQIESTEWVDHARGRTLCLTVTPADGLVDAAYVAVLAETETPSTLMAQALTRRGLFRAAFDQSLDAELIFDDDARIVEVNPATCSLIARSRAEIIGQPLTDLVAAPRVSPDQWERFKDAGALRGEIELGCADGRTVPVEYRAKANIAPGLHLAALRDVTAQKAHERELQATSERFQRTFDDAPVGVAIVDSDPSGLGEVRRANQVLCEILGRTEDAVVGTQLFEYFQAATGGLGDLARDVQDHVQLAGTCRRPNGDLRHVVLSGSLVDPSAALRPFAVVIVQDLSGRVHAEAERDVFRDQLYQSQKLEGIGRLAGGIAHDFNNLLAVILNYAEFAEQELDDHPEARSDVGEIKRAAKRAAALTQQLLTFSRRDVVTTEVFRLEDTVADMTSLLRRTLGEDIELCVETDADVPLVCADRGQVEQIVLNLAVNARDAMPNGGRLTVRTGPATVAAGDQANVPAGRYAVLSVTDTGTGMSAETATLAYEPFFTTKPVGQGSGLGLATVYGIVSQAGGHIATETGPGLGTSIAIHLPESTEPAREPVPCDDATGSDQAGIRILLVEDEPAVRTLTARLLRRQGYHVTEAPAGAAALALAEPDPTAFDLLLTDLVMPGMSGRELADALTLLHPDIAVVFSSGYTDDVITRHGLAESRWHFVKKPFTAATLLPAIRDAVQGRAA